MIWDTLGQTAQTRHVKPSIIAQVSQDDFHFLGIWQFLTLGRVSKVSWPFSGEGNNQSPFFIIEGKLIENVSSVGIAWKYF